MKLNKDFTAVGVGLVTKRILTCACLFLGLIGLLMIAGCGGQSQQRAEAESLYCIGVCMLLEAEQSTETGYDGNVDIDCDTYLAQCRGSRDSEIQDGD